MSNPNYWVPGWNCDYIPDAEEIWEFLELENDLTFIQFNKRYLPYLISDDKLHNLEILERLIKESGDVKMMRKYKINNE